MRTWSDGGISAQDLIDDTIPPELVVSKVCVANTFDKLNLQICSRNIFLVRAYYFQVSYYEAGSLEVYL